MTANVQASNASRARMPGRVSPAWCPHCNARPGPDCPVRVMTGRQVRRLEAAEVRRFWRQAQEEGR